MNTILGIRGIVSFSILFNACLGFSSEALDVWQWRNPVPTANALFVAGFGKNTFVVAGELGVVSRSADGLDWLTRNTGVTNTPRAFAFGNDQFVLVGDGGSILTSPDGVAWTLRASGTTQAFTGVAYGNGAFVVVGSGSTAVTSPDGVNWTARTVTNGQPVKIAFGNGLFVATMTNNSLATTPDGINWTPGGSLGNGELSAVIFGNGLFVAGGYLRQQFGLTPFHWTSTNGVNWTQAFSYTRTPVTYGNGLFVSLSSDAYQSTVATSTNGLTWTTQTNGYFSAIAGAFGNDHFLLVGATGNTLRSSDGVYWADPNPNHDLLTDVQFGNGRCIAVGGLFPFPAGTYVPRGPSILVSTNGRSFAPATAGVTQPLSSVAFGTSCFVTVGKGGAIYRSVDGRDWARRGSGTLQDLHGITHGDGRFVAVGDAGTIVTSPDGLVWTLRFGGSAYPLYGVAFVNDLFVVVGYFGTILTSPDAITWTVQYTDTPSALFRVAGGGGRFVAVGESGTVLTSANGGEWTSGSSGTSLNLYGLTYGDGVFLASGGAPPISGVSTMTNVLLSSTNGLDWVGHNPGTRVSLFGTAYLGGNFILAGDNGAILESGSARPVQLFGNWNASTGTYTLTSRGGQLGRVYRLQSCTKVAGGAWTDLTLFTNGPAGLYFVDQDASLRSDCFYRVTWP